MNLAILGSAVIGVVMLIIGNRLGRSQNPNAAVIWILPTVIGYVALVACGIFIIAEGLFSYLN